jgi:predicted aldo/keto reductase-like oxidoreductase
LYFIVKKDCRRKTMLYRKIKKTGDELSILGFGCMRLPQKRGTPGEGRIDEKRATSQIRYAIDHGVNYIDTAMHYHMGDSESFLGRALGNGYREKVCLATKLPPWSVKVSEDMDRLLTTQLNKLAADRIDYYLLHSLNRLNWDKMKMLGALEFLEKAKRDGRIINAGFSFHGDIDTFKEIVDAYDWSFCQIQYNFLDEKNQAGAEGLKYAANKGLGVIVMEPLRGGNLAGKVPNEVQTIWNEAEVKRSPAEWALRWVWNHPEVTVVLSGMNEEAHIEENLRIAGEALANSLTEKELILISRVESAYRMLTKAGCTGCRYCMPCPSGVDIPNCFEAYNKLHLFNEVHNARRYYLGVYGILGAAPSYASLCKECGKCLEKCPQHLPVPQLLKEVSKEFEDTRMKVLAWVAKRFIAIQGWGAIRKAKRIQRRQSH